MQMSDFKAKMHQIRFLLGVRPDPAGVSLQRSPDPLAVLERTYFCRERREGEEREKGRGGLPPWTVPQLGTLDPAVEKGRKGRKTRREPWDGAPRHIFPL